MKFQSPQGMATQFFQSLNLTITKNWPYGDQKQIQSPQCMTIDFFQLPNLAFGHQRCNDQKFVVTLLYGNRNYLVTIKQWQSLGWWPKTFGHHPTHPHHQMVTKIFQSLKGCKHQLLFWKKITLTFLFGRSKNFGHHLIMWVCQMAIKILQFPSKD